MDPGLEWAHRLLAIRFLDTRGINRPSIRKARSHAEEAARLAPYSVNALYVLVLCQLALRNDEEAANTAGRSLDANPHAALAHLTAGKVAERQKLADQAEQHYREGLRLEPENSELALALGSLLHRQGRDDDAADAYMAAGRADPTDSRARRGLATLGVPVLGAGAWFVIKLAVIQGLFRLGSRLAHPLPAAAVVTVVFALIAVITTAMHVKGSRRLPEHVAAGLRGDRINDALSWVRATAVVVAVIGIWAAAIPPSSGGGPAAAAALFAFAILAWLVVRYLQRGAPPPTLQRLRSIRRPLPTRFRRS